MDDKAKAFKTATKKNSKKQDISIKKPGAVLPKAGPSIKPKDRKVNPRVPQMKGMTRGR